MNSDMTNPFMLAEFYQVLYLADALYPGRPISHWGKDYREWFHRVTGADVPDGSLGKFVSVVAPIIVAKAVEREVEVHPTLRRYAPPEVDDQP